MFVDKGLCHSPAPELPFHLQYKLNRRQRLIPHLGVWGPMSLVIPAGLVACIAIAVLKSPWWGVALVPWMFFFRGFFFGLIDVIVHPIRDMDILIEENGLGFLVDGKRWYLFLDGILKITQYRKDTWTIQHFNGSVIHILASVITDDQIQYLKSAATRGHTIPS